MEMQKEFAGMEIIKQKKAELKFIQLDTVLQLVQKLHLKRLRQ